MPSEIIDVKVLDGYRLFLRFKDGVEGEIDISDVVPFEGVFARIRDRDEFVKVLVDHQWGTICWPGELDLAPEPLYERLTAGDKSRMYQAERVESAHSGLADSHAEPNPTTRLD